MPSFVRSTQPGWSGSRPSVRRLLKSMWLLQVATVVLLLVGQVHALRRLCTNDCLQDDLNLLFSLLYATVFHLCFCPSGAKILIVSCFSLAELLPAARPVTSYVRHR